MAECANAEIRGRRKHGSKVQQQVFTTELKSEPRDDLLTPFEPHRSHTRTNIFHPLVTMATNNQDQTYWLLGVSVCVQTVVYGYSLQNHYS